MIVAGLGCRKGTDADGVAAALALACRQAGIDLDSIGALATGTIKEDEPGILALAERLGLPLHIIGDDALKEAESETRTVSKHSLAKTVSPSLSEAAAIAAIDGAAELLVARVVAEGATCALARTRIRP
jgi:Cobalamin biosynthesis protein CbiG